MTSEIYFPETAVCMNRSLGYNNIMSATGRSVEEGGCDEGILRPGREEEFQCRLSNLLTKPGY